MTEGETRMAVVVGGAMEEPGAGVARLGLRAYGRVNRVRNHSGDLADNTWGTTDGDEANGDGALGADGEEMGLGDTDGPGS